MKLSLARHELDAGRQERAIEILDSCGWDRRGWEWGHLRRNTALIHTLGGHSHLVHCVRLAPTVSFSASASWDKTVRLWDARSGEMLHTLRGHTDQLRSVCFSPDGRRLASAAEDKSVRLWDVKTGQPIGSPLLHSDWVRCVCFHPDGQLLASAGNDRSVHLWDALTGRKLRSFAAHADDIWTVCFSSDGKHLATCSKDKTVRMCGTRRLGSCCTHSRGTPNWSTVFASARTGNAWPVRVKIGRHIWDAPRARPCIPLCYIPTR